MALVAGCACVLAALLGRGAGDSSAGSLRVSRITNSQGELERTVFMPNDPEEDRNYVLISDSSQNKFNGENNLKVKVGKRRRRRPAGTRPAGTRPGTLPATNTDLKDPKFLSLLTIVRFGNEDCGGGGICYTEAECRELGGSAQGPCASGFGVCCMLEVGCGEETARPRSLFVGAAQGACTLSVLKSPGAKQIRLDFIKLELEPPTDGNCLTDRLLIAGQNMNNIVPIICGANSGQHMYLDVDETRGPILVSVISTKRQDFKVRVSQLCDGDQALSPPGCLQYFTSQKGRLESFNYQEPPADSTYLNNLNYAMCIRKGPGMCSVEYQNSDESGEYKFDLRNADLEGDSTVPEGEAGAEVFNCPEDYLTVAGVRLCGQQFNDATTEADFTKSAPVIDRSNGPFILSFTSSPANTGRGFRLHYQQQPC